MSAALNQILYTALVAPDDIQTISAITGLRRKLKSSGIDPSKINIFQTADRPRSDDVVAAMLLAGRWRGMYEVADKKLSELKAKIKIMEEKEESREAGLREENETVSWGMTLVEFLDRVAVTDCRPKSIDFVGIEEPIGPIIEAAIDCNFIRKVGGYLCLTEEGHEFLGNQPRAWRLAQAAPAVVKPTLRNLTVTEYVTKMAYTPAEAEAEKRRIDIARHAGKITTMAASKHKAWVSRRTTKND